MMVAPGWSGAFEKSVKTTLLRKIPTHAFAANALYLEVIRLAYNLVTAFQRTCLPQEWQSLTLSKLRYRLFWVPGTPTGVPYAVSINAAPSGVSSHSINLTFIVQ